MPLSGITIAIAISELLAAFLIWRLWRSDDHPFFKIALTGIAPIPFLGPILVLWLADFPTAQAAVFQDRWRYRTDVLDRWRDAIDEKNPHAKFRKWQAMIRKSENESTPGNGTDLF